MHHAAGFLLALALVATAALGADIGTGPPAGASVVGITWRPAADQPHGGSEAHGVVVGGVLYSLGGFDVTKPCCSPTRRAYRYDAAADAWVRIADLPEGLTHGAFATDGTDVLFAGGYVEKPGGQPGQVFGSTHVWRWSPSTGQASPLPPLPVARAAGGMGWIDGRLHYVGGTNLARTVDEASHFVLDVASGATAWVEAPRLPNGRTHFATVVLDGRLWVLGGQHGHDAPLVPLGDVDVYDPATGAWTPRAAMGPRNHAMSTTLVIDGQIVVLGGQSTHGVALSSVLRYDPAGDTWATIGALPQARHSAVAGFVGGEVVVSTGNSSARSWRGSIQRGTSPPPPTSPTTPPTTVGPDLDPPPVEPEPTVPDRAGRLVPVGPTRILDTRRAPGVALPDGGTSTTAIAGQWGVPATGVTAVVVNVTATATTGAGYVQALPTGVAPGGASTLNVERADQTVANLAIVPLGRGGAIDVHVQRGAHVVVDLVAFVTTDGVSARGDARSGRYVPRTPQRIVDTRTGFGEVPTGAVPAGGTLRVQVPGVPDDATSVALNVTATEAASGGFVQVLPPERGVAYGSSSSLNPGVGQTVANLVLTPVTRGAFEVYVQEATHLVVDVLGYTTGPSAQAGDDGLFVPLVPGRVVDTRAGVARPAPGSTTYVCLLDQAGLPAGGFSAVAANVTATQAAGPGFVQAAPRGAAWAASSTLNVERAGQTVANAALLPVDAQGYVGLGTEGGTQLLLDVGGYFTS